LVIRARLIVERIQITNSPDHQMASSSPVIRIGIFGGTFNPIHLGHLRSAEEVREAQGLDRILFIPSASPPHKGARDLAGAAHRLAMVKLAIAGNPHFRASSIELQRDGRSYSIDTLRLLRQRQPRAQFAFILGLDAFQEIGTWKEYRSLFGLCEFIVTSRPQYRAVRLRALLPVAARGEFCYSPDGLSLEHRSGHRVVYQRISDFAISASAIRERLRAGASIRYLVHESVSRYIARHHLYSRRFRAQ
jgi:nicotinate-nucleotide adenylyltransferase